ncbi:hypothetical protein [Tropicimonas sp. IMCC6043]|uniref:hypothetical protein n=1 Tax=Tropicimonas sp. IMCC6043 TaxID=2510645 RepID=UPI00101D8CB0|nr:hypothetical protein [Tropicimonas sp. IMCC6043]RYH07616.1 hypothetical protein EU800_19640 [Tropicimonas sp. IMCC6043]
MRERDIYKWRWKDEHDREVPYCGYSQLCVVWKGGLYDTYCGVLSERSRLDPNAVEIEFLGNEDDMIKLLAGIENYYRPEDVVDMRHPNNPRAPIYLKRGAERNAGIMLAWALTEIEKNHARIRASQNRIKALHHAVTQIESGRLDDVYV